MNRTNIAIVIATVAALLAIGNAQTRPQASGPVGRYQLLTGEHAMTGKTTSYDQKDVFRIDTVTGETSFYTAGYDRDGKVYSEWLPIR